ncbi:HEAT repeats [uncultured archaeon]|nr:HEAT repeats [uncultured archaeon]
MLAQSIQNGGKADNGATLIAVDASGMTPAPDRVGTLRSLDMDGVLAEANRFAVATGRRPILGALKRTPLPEKDISEMEPELKEAVVKLRHARIDVKLDGISRIGNMKDAAAAVPALVRLLNDQDENVRFNAAWAIGKIGKGVKEAAPFLMDALNDACCDVKRASATALGEIGDPSAISHLETLANIDRDWTLRHAIGAALKKLKASQA